MINTHSQRTFPWTCANRVWSPTVYGNGWSKGTVSTFTDVKSIGWGRNLLAKGEKKKYLFNPMQSSTLSIKTEGSGLSYTTVNPTCTGPNLNRVELWEGDLYSALVPLALNSPLVSSDLYSGTTLRSDLIDEVATSCRAGIRAGDAQGLESLAQYKQAIELLKNPTKNILRIVSTASKRRKSTKDAVRATKSVLKDASGEYLKYRYGIKPMVSDIQAIIKSLCDSRLSNLHTSRSNAKITKTVAVNVDVLAVDAKITFLISTTHEVLVRCMSLDRYKSSMVSDLGLGLDQIPVTAWNLVPFSFVVDWFANIGDFINSLVPRLDLVHMGSCYTITETVTTTVSAIGTVPNNPSVSITQPCTGSSIVISTKKSRVVGLPPPRLMVKNDFRFDRITRVGDAFALISQKMLGRRS